MPTATRAEVFVQDSVTILIRIVSTEPSPNIRPHDGL